MANNDFTSQTVKNLLVPAFGDTKAVKFRLPSNNGYRIDFNTVLIDDAPFQPQSVTVDATALASTDYVEFRVLDIEYIRRVKGGNMETFNFPSVRNLRVIARASDAVSPVVCYFYNYPAFPDMAGAQDVALTPTTALDVHVLTTPLAGYGRNAITLALPVGALVAGTAIIAAAVGAKIRIHSIICQIPNTTALAATNLILFGSASLMEIMRAGLNIAAVGEVLEYSPAIPFDLAINDGLSYKYSVATTLTAPPILSIDYEVI